MPSCTETPSAAKTSLWRRQDFRRYLTGQAASVAGSSITRMALPVALFLQLACAGAVGTAQRTIGQVVTADGMQARMQAVSTWLTSGARPVAALLAGGLGTWIGVRPALVAGTCLLVVPLVVLYRSPLRGLLDMPGSPAVAPASCEPDTPPTPSGLIVPDPAVASDVRHDRSAEGGL